MKKRLLAVVFVMLALASAVPRAQLLRPNPGGLTMGVIVLNVTDVAAHKKFWVDEFDAKLVKVGQLEGATIPGFVILFRPQAATGPSEGSTINHIGLKLNKLSDFTARFDRGGYKYDKPRIGRETTPQTYVTGPDGFRIELVEDPTLPVPVIGHHLHYWMADPEAVKKWYVETLHLAPTYRGPYPAGDVPGMNYTFAPLGSQKGAGVPTKGRVLDQVGLDVADLKGYCAQLQAAGVKFDVPYGKDSELGLMSATITDPWGASIRLTEGLNKVPGVGVATFSYTDPYLSTTPR
jgi:catechol 2,3-dioxygenase-like lactoylglutathione lyase family enzyme